MGLPINFGGINSLRDGVIILFDRHRLPMLLINSGSLAETAVVDTMTSNFHLTTKPLTACRAGEAKIRSVRRTKMVTQRLDCFIHTVAKDADIGPTARSTVHTVSRILQNNAHTIGPLFTLYQRGIVQQ